MDQVSSKCSDFLHTLTKADLGLKFVPATSRKGLWLVGAGDKPITCSWNTVSQEAEGMITNFVYCKLQGKTPMAGYDAQLRDWQKRHEVIRQKLSAVTVGRPMWGKEVTFWTLPGACESFCWLHTQGLTVPVRLGRTIAVEVFLHFYVLTRWWSRIGSSPKVVRVTPSQRATRRESAA